MTLQRVESQSRYAPVIGFSKAVRAGNLVFVAGMTAIDADGEAVGGTDAYLQARESLRKALDALAACGASASGVVQTRMYLVDPTHWEDVGRAHGEVFADARPVATMVVVKQLLDAQMLVEIEVVAALS